MRSDPAVPVAPPVPRNGVRARGRRFDVRTSPRIPSTGTRSERLGEREPPNHVRENHPPCRSRSVAAVVALTSSELRVGPRTNVPTRNGDEVAREHAFGGATPLRRSDRIRVRESHHMGTGGRRKKRRTVGAKCGTAGSGSEWQGVAREEYKRRRSSGLRYSVRPSARYYKSDQWRRGESNPGPEALPRRHLRV
ncbi:hypothetical protein VT84_30995 [Gemmata sp. SH-PL17]|nr:hypothetical protein VT84_30995 [Gemmata sp. SH-PL17]